MSMQATLLSPQTTMPIALYNSQQLYTIEQAWFAQGHDSFGLMHQAAWQMAQHIKQLSALKSSASRSAGMSPSYPRDSRQQRASIWVGQGNNGGDGWLIAYYLQQAGWQVQVIIVSSDKSSKATVNDNKTNNKAANNKGEQASIADAIKAKQLALSINCHYQYFEDSVYSQINTTQSNTDNNARPREAPFTDIPLANVYVDALFGIGLDRIPTGVYKQAITSFNWAAKHATATESLVVAVDIPSGLVASTGQVFERIAIQADVTLCLIARKFGLHTKDGNDYSGEVLDIPLIPYQTTDQALTPVATLLNTAHDLSARRQNSYKGSYGQVLIIGGNRVDGSQGMGGAAILAASSAMATGAGKITVACHEAFHGALLTSLPDAMTISLHDEDGVKRLIADARVVAIGMGLGRDKKAQHLFITYIQAAIAQGKPIVIDADGLYHLASLHVDNPELVAQLRQYSTEYSVCLTPHSGEAAKLLDREVSDVESDRLAAIKQCAAIYGGAWVLKGVGSLVLEPVLEPVLEQHKVYVCGTGNAGMATAGMGDILSGVTAGLLAQQDLEGELHSLHQAVLIHGLAGDRLVNSDNNASLLIGQRGLQAQDMPAAIRHVMQLLIIH
ncbi:hydroxyethylthiazole kinase-like uncharacterized protein yjeF [Psychrobacter sp. PL19]|uniref:NAD(P)H-hydrate dehydratase n=1 Tax=Psychrobacter sp. PL19 TaxID=2760711 RepID=UPI001AE9AC84